MRTAASWRRSAGTERTIRTLTPATRRRPERAGPDDFRRGGALLPTLEAGRAIAVQRIARIAALVVVLLLCAFFAMTQGARGGRGDAPTLLDAAVAATLLLANGWFYLRPITRTLPLTRLASETGLAVVGCSLSLSLVTLHDGYGSDWIHAAVVIAMCGYTLLLPLPPRLSIPFVCLAASTWPAVQFFGGRASPSDFAFASQLAAVAGGAGLAGSIALLHDFIFTGRYRILGNLARLAEQDALTGALNRRTLAERLKAEAERARRYGVSFGAVMYDIDGFRRFNSTWGFAAGDAMLKALAASLERALREPAFVALRGLVARYGGEEFIVLLPGARPEQVERFAERSRACLQELRVPYAGTELNLTASVGAHTVSPSPSVDAGAVLAAVDAALYRAKARGGNVVEIARPIADGDPVADIELLSRQVRLRAPHADGLTPAVTAEISSLQVSAFRIAALAGALWLMLFALLDVAVLLGPYPSLPLSTMLALRVGAALLMAIPVVALPFVRPDAFRNFAWQGALTVGGCLLLAWFMSLTGGWSSPYLIGVVYTLLSWSIALGAPLWIGAPVGVFSIGSVPLMLHFLCGESLWEIENMQRTGVLVSAFVVASVAQRLFTGLRAEEAAMRVDLRALARIDPLAGINNRAGFEPRALAELARAESTGTPISMILFDLDHFKTINDIEGHAAGDEAIARAAEAVEAHLRTVDVFARLGGDEFVVLLPHTEGPGAALLADRLREQLDRIVLRRSGRRISASLGVAEWEPGLPLPVLLDRCDRALRRAKREGRDRVCVWDADRDSGPRAPHEAVVPLVGGDRSGAEAPIPDHCRAGSESGEKR